MTKKSSKSKMTDQTALSYGFGKTPNPFLEDQVRRATKRVGGPTSCTADTSQSHYGVGGIEKLSLRTKRRRSPSRGDFCRASALSRSPCLHDVPVSDSSG
jgi:hypothetical protein